MKRLFVLLMAVLLLMGGALAEDTAAQVATADEMATPEEVVEPGMTPVTADRLVDGEYSVTVKSSSPMFNIVACTLTVENGTMTADMTMAGTGYLRLFMGKGEEAVNAAEETCIPFVEDADGAHHFTVPVTALDAGIDCAAYSRKKEKWYDRVLLFRADSLPLSAFADGAVTTAAELSLADGTYTAQVTLSGGSGRASVASTAVLTVAEGCVTATVVFSSKNYDYVLVDGEKYLNENAGGESTFTIPVAGFDFPLPLIGDTLAMGTPHEISYTLTFASDSLQPAE